MDSTTTITRAQYVKACLAFWDALGYDAGHVYFPVQLDADQIVFPRVPSANGGHFRAPSAGFAAASTEVLSIQTVVKVVD